MTKSKLFGSIALIAVLSIGAYAGYVTYGDQLLNRTAKSPAMLDRELLTYVPADTLVFFGGLEPAAFQSMIDMMPPDSDWLAGADWTQQLGVEEQAQLPPAYLLFTSLMASYAEIIKDPSTAAAKLGWGQQVDAAFYTVGFLPVLRIKLLDAPAFVAFVNSAQQRFNLTPEMSSAGDFSIRAYGLDKPDAEEPTGTALVIGTNSQYAVITLGGKLLDTETRSAVLGLQKPELSLAHVSTLQDIKNKHNFHPAYIGYLSHTEVMKGLTGNTDSAFAKMLDSFSTQASAATSEEIDATENAGNSEMAAQTPEPTMAPEATAALEPGEEADITEMPTANKDFLASIQTEACRTELMALTAVWPQTVFGYTKLDLAGQPKTLVTRTVVENTDPAFMQSMRSLRGFTLPVLSDTREKPLFGFGLGLNVDGLVPFVTAAVQSFTAKEYQCAGLADLRQQMLQTNPAMMLSMVSGMVSGLQGMSAVIMDMDADLNLGAGEMVPPNIKSIDALISITSNNPQGLITMANGLNPEMPPITMPADGSAIDFPFPLPIAAQVKLAIKGKHLVAFTGARATALADALAAAAPTPNGLFALSMDYARYVRIMADVTKQMETRKQDEFAPTSFTDEPQGTTESGTGNSMQLLETAEIENGGLVMEIKMIIGQ